MLRDAGAPIRENLCNHRRAMVIGGGEAVSRMGTTCAGLVVRLNCSALFLGRTEGDRDIFYPWERTNGGLSTRPKFFSNWASWSCEFQTESYIRAIDFQIFHESKRYYILMKVWIYNRFELR